MAKITVTIGKDAQGTNVKDGEWFIKKDINAYDYFVSTIGRAPTADDTITFVVEANVAVIGTLANLSGFYSEPDPWVPSVQKWLYQKPLSSMGALTFDDRFKGLKPKIFLDNYGAIIGKGGDAIPTFFIYDGVVHPSGQYPQWGYDLWYGYRAYGNTALKLGNNVTESTEYAVYVRNFGIIAGGGGAGAAVASTHSGLPDDESWGGLDSMSAGAGGGAPYGKGSSVDKRPQWKGGDATLMTGGIGYNRGTVRYNSITYSIKGGDGGDIGRAGKRSDNTHPYAGGPDGFRPYEPFYGEMPGFYAEGSVYLNNHDSGYTRGRVFDAKGWVEQEEPGIITRIKSLSASINGTNVYTTHRFTYQEIVEPEVTVTTYDLEIKTDRFTTYKVLDEIRAKYGDSHPKGPSIVNIKVADYTYVIGTTAFELYPAIDTFDFPYEATINIENRGLILGRGGTGVYNEPAINNMAMPAGDGGPAFRIGSNVAVVVNNYATIAGGGGGGGGVGNGNFTTSLSAGGSGAPLGEHKKNFYDTTENSSYKEPTAASAIIPGKGGFRANQRAGDGGYWGLSGNDGANGVDQVRKAGLGGKVAVGSTQKLIIHNIGQGTTTGRA